VNEYFINYHLLYNYWGPFPRTLSENIIEIARGMNRVNIVFFRERHCISMLSLYLFDFKRHFWVGELTFFVDYHLKGYVGRQNSKFTRKYCSTGHPLICPPDRSLVVETSVKKGNWFMTTTSDTLQGTFSFFRQAD
jgi:hypothetical protein